VNDLFPENECTDKAPTTADPLQAVLNAAWETSISAFACAAFAPISFGAAS